LWNNRQNTNVYFTLISRFGEAPRTWSTRRLVKRTPKLIAYTHRWGSSGTRLKKHSIGKKTFAHRLQVDSYYGAIRFTAAFEENSLALDVCFIYDRLLYATPPPRAQNSFEGRGAARVRILHPPPSLLTSHEFSGLGFEQKPNTSDQWARVPHWTWLLHLGGLRNRQTPKRLSAKRAWARGLPLRPLVGPLDVLVRCGEALGQPGDRGVSDRPTGPPSGNHSAASTLSNDSNPKAVPYV